MATLVLISTPGKDLTYEDGDIVSCMHEDVSPGTAVVANVGGHWSFVYITDRDCNASEVEALTESWTEGDDEDQQFLAKRRTYCTLPGDAAQYQTFYSYEEAPAEMKMTWAEFSALLTVKQA